MKERKGLVTFKGNPLTLVGSEITNEPDYDAVLKEAAKLT